MPIATIRVRPHAKCAAIRELRARAEDIPHIQLHSSFTSPDFAVSPDCRIAKSTRSKDRRWWTIRWSDKPS